MSILAFILGLSAYVAVAGWDTWRSLYQPLYTTGEKTKHLRGKDGYFSLTKGLIFDGIFAIAPGVIVSILFTPYAGAVWWGIIALTLFLRLERTWRNYKEAKQTQFDSLRWRRFSALRLVPFKGQFVLEPFYDIRGNNLTEVTERLIKLANKPESEWWKLDRAKSL